jgi:hypothetical protein
LKNLVEQYFVTGLGNLFSGEKHGKEFVVVKGRMMNMQLFVNKKFLFLFNAYHKFKS